MNRDTEIGLRELDWLMVAVVLLCCLGLVMAVSVSAPRPEVGPLLAMKGQGSKLLVGLAVFLVAAMVRLDWCRRWAVPLLAFSVLLCLLTLLFPNPHGARRWIRIAGGSFQPVELARCALIFYSAAWIARAGEGLRQFRAGFLPLMGPAVLLTLCLLLQPDVGNAVFVMTLAAAMAIVGGARISHFVVAGLPLVAVMAVLGMRYGHVQDRLTRFLDIEQGGQVWQSLVAISSGGVLGAGLGEGWMKMGFVPEAGNDFVFAIVGEELGLVGSVAVVALYAIIGAVGARLVFQMRDPFYRMLVFGLTFAICMQAAINLLVVTGLAPAKGIDLPFLSSGGTNLAFSLGAIGIIGNAARTDLSRAA
jgi:cell division protein FtsW